MIPARPTLYSRKTRVKTRITLSLINTVILTIIIIPSLVFLIHIHRKTLASGTTSTTSTSTPLRRVTPPQDPSSSAQEQTIRKPLENKISEITPTSHDKSTSLTYPSPLPPSSKIILAPTFGTHRRSKNAILALAEGYDRSTYALFLTSLRNTGYDGDVVFGVSALNKLSSGVESFLRGQSGVVVYAIDWDCFTKKGERTGHANGGYTDCNLRNVYEGKDGAVLEDPRDKRPVATARYELYWVWSLRYDPHVHVMLIDVRDTYFQLDPFKGLVGSTGDAGVLYFYGENFESTDIGRSRYNSRWIRQAYGENALKQIKDKPTICSGSTIGEAIAIEAYLRAMVQQFPDTHCTSVGCDQGFHNYLYYFDKLQMKEIKDIVVVEQGKGIINNLAAMRIKPLKEWGILKDNGDVMNWDGTLSPVVHQVDRDKDLNAIIKRRRGELSW